MKDTKSIILRAISCAEKARREGLLALEEDLSELEDDFINRDIFILGMRLVVEGTDSVYISKVLENIIEQETDPEIKRLKRMEKEAVMMIGNGDYPAMIYLMLNSYTNESLQGYKEFLDS
jgi:chemotaxis protein MotA